MKHFPIKRADKKTKVFIVEGVRPHFPKPKLPLVMFWNVHKSENIYLGWK